MEDVSRDGGSFAGLLFGRKGIVEFPGVLSVGDGDDHASGDAGEFIGARPRYDLDDEFKFVVYHCAAVLERE